jgi:hypothetical protein
MEIKIKGKTYNSDDIPICLFFASYEYKDNFLKDLIHYKEGKFLTTKSINGVLAGNKWFCDPRFIYKIRFDDLKSAKSTQQTLFNTSVNSIIFTPVDIETNDILKWLKNYEKNFNKMFEKFLRNGRVKS